MRCAGSLFVGPWSAQVAGDYAIGSNHVLPTAGAARFRGGLNAADFVRLVSIQRVTRRGLRRIAPTITALATAEAAGFVVGLAGSFVGGLLASLLAGDGLELRPSGLIGSAVGATVILLAMRATGTGSQTPS